MASQLYSHEPVMADEVIALLQIRPDGIYVDATAGAGGHAERIAEQLNSGRLIAMDRDPEAVDRVQKRLQRYPHAVVVHGNYSAMRTLLGQMKVESVDGVLLDAGVSSMQLDCPERGFSFQAEGPLDMRMDTTASMDAAEWLFRASQDEIAQVLRDFGDVGPAKRIARAIVSRRDARQLQRTSDLVAAVSEALDFVSGVPAEVRTVFQAVRIAVNEELLHLEIGLRQAADLLTSGGRLVAITFHSGEDRIAKQLFRVLTHYEMTLAPDGRVLEKRMPAFRAVTKKPVLPTPAEITRNARAKSAKVRAIERIGLI